MCGRFSLTQPEQLASTFGVEVKPFPPPRYNIAPSQPLGVVVGLAEGKRQFRLMQWGLIPSWAKDPKIGARLINARVETAREKPSFRAAFKRRRCLIPADGFYEWQQLDQRKKQPWYFQLPGKPVFAFAGLWESWQEIETCTILTMAANQEMKPYHQRMPIILAPADYDRWLDPTQTNGQEVEQWITEVSIPSIEAMPITKAINNPKQDSPDCLQPLPEEEK